VTSSSTISSPPQFTSSSESIPNAPLTAGAKAGIAIGALLFAVSLFGISGFLIFRLGESSGLLQRKSSTKMGFEKAEMDAEATSKRKDSGRQSEVELDGRSMGGPVELDATEKAELAGMTSRATSVHQLC
jgi:hypothetical protein